MLYEHLKSSTLPRALSDVAADLADLLQKEMRLARAELSAKLTTKLQAGVWFGAAAVLALVCAFLLLQALIFGIASFGLAMHWSCLIVAALVGAAGGFAFYKGRADAQESLTPDRAIEQIKRDIATTKEQLT